MEDLKWSDIEKCITQKLMAQNETLASEVIKQAKADAKKWFTSFLIALAGLLATNVWWIYYIVS